MNMRSAFGSVSGEEEPVRVAFYGKAARDEENVALSRGQLRAALAVLASQEQIPSYFEDADGPSCSRFGASKATVRVANPLRKFSTVMCRD